MMMVMSSSFELNYYFDSASYQEAVEHSKLAQEYFVAEKKSYFLECEWKVIDPPQQKAEEKRNNESAQI
ncbi:hypothetical protein [Vibrio navarrensis]|nr:hypothetical protein [Vibrio navarrensis]